MKSNVKREYRILLGLIFAVGGWILSSILGYIVEITIIGSFSRDIALLTSKHMIMYIFAMFILNGIFWIPLTLLIFFKSINKGVTSAFIWSLGGVVVSALIIGGWFSLI